MRRFEGLKKEEVPKDTVASGVTMNLGELRDAVARFPEATWPSLSYSDSGGFESCLSQYWLIHAEEVVWMTTHTDCRPYTLKFEGNAPKSHDEFLRADKLRPGVINFRYAKVKWASYVQRWYMTDIMQKIDYLPDSTPICLAGKKNFSDKGEHWILPLTSAGPQVWVNGKDEYSYEPEILSLDSCLKDSVSLGDLK